MIPIRRMRRFFPMATALSISVAALQAQEEPADLIQARTAYQRDTEFATRPIRERYIIKLETLKRTLGSRGDIRAALAVQEELDKIHSTGASFERFAGTWSVLYNGGTARTYNIKPDGTFTFTEENGKPLPTRLVGKLRVSGADITVEHEANRLERLSISGGKLVLEQFSPKATYPAGAPQNSGTGTKVGAPKP